MENREKVFCYICTKEYNEKELSASSVDWRISPMDTQIGKMPLISLTSMKGLSAMQILY